jgi:hypothetical protein
MAISPTAQITIDEIKKRMAYDKSEWYSKGSNVKHTELHILFAELDRLSLQADEALEGQQKLREELNKKQG